MKPKTVRGLIYGLMFIFTLLGFTFIMSLNKAKADSLVCFYSGTSKIMSVYTERSKSTEYRAVKSIGVFEVYSRVRFYDGDDMYFSHAIPCIEIEDDRNDKTNLDEFYRHLQPK